MSSTTSEPLRCPCGTTFHGVESATCSAQHAPIRLDWWPICKCGHDSHYDMATFCLAKGCGCEEYTASERRRQVTRRSI